jgi:hypothetical protein
MNETLESLLGIPGEIDVALQQAGNAGRGEHDLDLVVDVRPLRWLPVGRGHSALAQVRVSIELVAADPQQTIETTATIMQDVIGLKHRCAQRLGLTTVPAGEMSPQRVGT